MRIRSIRRHASNLLGGLMCGVYSIQISIYLCLSSDMYDALVHDGEAVQIDVEGPADYCSRLDTFIGMDKRCSFRCRTA